MTREAPTYKYRTNFPCNSNRAKAPEPDLEDWLNSDDKSGKKKSKGKSKKKKTEEEEEEKVLYH